MLVECKVSSHTCENNENVSILALPSHTLAGKTFSYKIKPLWEKCDSTHFSTRVFNYIKAFNRINHWNSNEK